MSGRTAPRARSVNEAGSGGAHAAPHRTLAGVLLGLFSALLAVALATSAVARPGRMGAPDRALPLRRPQPGHVGDHVARLLVGATALGVPARPGLLGG
ncbi:hypothetical protein [Streptomyces sp. NPDC002386]